MAIVDVEIEVIDGHKQYLFKMNDGSRILHPLQSGEVLELKVRSRCIQRHYEKTKFEIAYDKLPNWKKVKIQAIMRL